MNCEQVQNELATYLDQETVGEIANLVEAHLSNCPLCRIRRDEYRQITQTLRNSAAVPTPENLSSNIRTALELELIAMGATKGTPRIATLPERSFLSNIEHWLMPFSLATFSTFIFSVLLLTGILITQDTNSQIVRNESNENLLVSANIGLKDIANPGDPPIALEGFTPRINPNGSLNSLSIAASKIDAQDKELVFVANVFKNGYATLNENQDSQINPLDSLEIKQALDTDPEKAPFLPPVLNQDSDSVRVVVKVIWVDVNLGNPSL